MSKLVFEETVGHKAVIEETDDDSNGEIETVFRDDCRWHKMTDYTPPAPYCKIESSYDYSYRIENR